MYLCGSNEWRNEKFNKFGVVELKSSLSIECHVKIGWILKNNVSMTSMVEKINYGFREKISFQRVKPIKKWNFGTLIICIAVVSMIDRGGERGVIQEKIEPTL